MGESARILATESMTEAKKALAEFAETVDRTLLGVDADIQRMGQWLQHDRPAHWKREVRVREDGVLKARSAIARKEIVAAPQPAGVVEERKAFDKAKRRLEEAQRRQEATRRWAPDFERRAMAYKGAAHQLRSLVSAGIPAALIRISRMIESVEAYLSVAPPSGDVDAPPPDVEPPQPAPGGELP